MALWHQLAVKIADLQQSRIDGGKDLDHRYCKNLTFQAEGGRSYTDDGRDHVNLLFRREKGGVQQGVEGKERGEKLAGKVSCILFSFIVIIPVIIATVVSSPLLNIRVVKLAGQVCSLLVLLVPTMFLLPMLLARCMLLYTSFLSSLSSQFYRHC